MTFPISRPRRSAFTLVELLVVIGIIALLISILLPTLSRARQSANVVYCLSNLRQMGVAANLYTDAYKGSRPIGIWGNSGPFAAPAGSETDWALLLSAMLNDQEATYSDDERAEEQSVFLDTDTQPSGVPDRITDRAEIANHYTSHPRLIPDYGQRDPYHNPKRRVPYKLSQIKDSPEKVMIFDGVQVLDQTGSNGSNGSAIADGWRVDSRALRGVLPVPTFLLSTTDDSPAVIAAGTTPDTSVDGGPNVDHTIASPVAGDAGGNIRWRHQGDTRANFLFADGHADGHKYKDRTNTMLLRRNVNVSSNY